MIRKRLTQVSGQVRTKKALVSRKDEMMFAIEFSNGGLSLPLKFRFMDRNRMIMALVVAKGPQFKELVPNSVKKTKNARFANEVRLIGTPVVVIL